MVSRTLVFNVPSKKRKARVRDELGAQVAVERPSDDPTAVAVHHRGDVLRAIAAGARGYVSKIVLSADIRDPSLEERYAAGIAPAGRRESRRPARAVAQRKLLAL
jgi:hypothetical protein